MSLRSASNVKSMAGCNNNDVHSCRVHVCDPLSGGGAAAGVHYRECLCWRRAHGMTETWPATRRPHNPPAVDAGHVHDITRPLKRDKHATCYAMPHTELTPIPQIHYYYYFVSIFVFTQSNSFPHIIFIHSIIPLRGTNEPRKWNILLEEITFLICSLQNCKNFVVYEDYITPTGVPQDSTFGHVYILFARTEPWDFCKEDGHKLKLFYIIW